MLVIKCLRTTLIALPFLISFALSGQSIIVETSHYNENNGLSRYANCIYKDSRGVLWMGTEYGLYRFDGKHFVHFTTEDGLPFPQIMEIYEDTDGWFWLYRSCQGKTMCQRKLAFFHPISRQVLTFEQRFGQETAIRPADIVSVRQDAEHIYFTATKQLLSWNGEEGLRQTPIKGIADTPNLWAKINENRFGISYQQNGIPQYGTIDTLGNIHQRPFPIPIDGLGERGLLELLHRSFQFESIRIKNLEISFSPAGDLIVDTLGFNVSVVSDTLQYHHYDQRLAITDSGNRYHPDLGQVPSPSSIYSTTLNKKLDHSRVLTSYIKEPGASSWRQQSSEDGSRDVFFDYETNTAWIVNRLGVHAYQFKTQYFTHYVNQDIQEQLAATAVELGQGAILMQAENTYFLAHGENSDRAHHLLSVLQSIPGNSLTSAFLLEEEQAYFWAINEEHLIRINTTTFDYTLFSLPNDVFQPRLLMQWGHLLWIGQRTGIHLFDTETGAFLAFLEYNEFDSLRNTGIYFFKKTDHDRLWIGTLDGLYLYEKGQGITALYSENAEGNYQLPARTFYHMSAAKQGGYWFATSNGLIHWNPDESMQQAPTAEGYLHISDLPFKGIIAAYEDDHGFVWLPTDQGLIQHELQTGLSKMYQKADGLTNSGFQPMAHLRATNGTLYLGGYEGFNVFHPKYFQLEELSPNISLIIVDFEVYDGRTDSLKNCLPSLVREGEILMQPGDKFFNIRVSSSDYTSAMRHDFEFKVEGYHKEWQTRTSNLIQIIGLPYGDFRLKIRKSLPNNLIPQSILEIPIQVVAPFYLQPSFITGFAILFLTAAYFLYQWRIRLFRKRQQKLETEVAHATQTIRAQNQELKELDKLKSNFFANVSHELRTPLTLMLAPVHSVINNKNLNSGDRTKLLLAQKNGERLHRMINEILDLTKLESGKLEVSPITVSWYNFLRRIVTNFESLAHRKQIDFQLKYSGSSYLQLSIDSKKTETILLNLLSNAFKFTPQNGTVSLCSRDTGENMEIQVTDTGQGIHPDDLPHIFDRFYRSVEAHKLQEGGTGIGLFLSRQFAKLLGAELRVTSQLGEGSNFTFVFPKIEVIGKAIEVESISTPSYDPINAVPVVQSVKQEPQHNNREAGTTKVLLVEDNIDLQDFLSSLLVPAYQLAVATNGKEALQILEIDELPQLIISDVMMPVMDGYQFLESLKGNDKYRHIPVVMLTAKGSIEDKLTALRIGVDDFMTKPFNEEELLARVENLLLHSKHRSEVQGKEDKQKGRVPGMVRLTKVDQAWLKKLEITIINRIGEFDFSLESLSYEIGSSRWQLNRRTKQLTGLTSKQYLQEVRLNHARHLLENGMVSSVKALSYEVGIKDVRYFSRQFKQRFGKLPSAYL